MSDKMHHWKFWQIIGILEPEKEYLLNEKA